MKGEVHYIYMLRCQRDRLYTGYADDLRRRLVAHGGSCRGAKFTRSFKPLGLAQCWRARTDRGTVLKIEHLIKSMTRKRKDKLIEAPSLLCGLISSAMGLEVDIVACLDEFQGLRCSGPDILSAGAIPRGRG
jgi:putative endonuclease